MEIYIYIFLISLFSAIVNKKTLGYFIAILLFIVLAGRAETVGIDTANYYNNHFSALYDGLNHSYEWMFIYLCDEIRTLNLNPRCCLYLLAFITISLIGMAAKRFHSSLPLVYFFFILFGYFTHSLNVARQIAACSIILYSYSFLCIPLDKKKIFKPLRHGVINKYINEIAFTTLVIIASAFHASSIIAIICLPISKLKLEKFSFGFISTLIASVSLFAIIQVGRTIVLNYFNDYLNIITIYDGIGSSTTETSLSVFGFFYRSINYVFSCYVLCKIKNDSKLYNLFAFSIFTRVLMSAFYGSILRIGFPFWFIDMIVFSKYIERDKKNTKFLILCCLYYGFECIGSHISNIYETVPYKFELINIFQ